MPSSSTSAKTYDLIAIGGGSGGLGATAIARTIGLETLLIDANANNIGGDCLNYGCVPSKALIHVSRLAQAARESESFGLEVGGAISFAKALQHVHAAQQHIRDHENVAWLEAQAHQDVAIGWAKFVDRNTVEVDGQQYSARRIVLATGSRPRKFDVTGVDEVQTLHTNHTFFEKERELPKRLLVIGGGAIGCELGQAMQRLGSEVTIINRGERLLSNEPEFASEILERVMIREGMTVHHGAEVERFSEGNVAHVKQGAKSFAQPFDEVLVAIGRDASVSNMNLSAAGIDTDKRGNLIVDDYYQTTNKRVYAVGDAMNREKFSHGAEMHNRDLIRNLLIPFKKRHTLSQFSWVTFTGPEVASFGLSPKQLTKQGISFEVVDQPFKDDDRAIASGYSGDAHLRLYVQKKGLLGKVYLLGGTMIAPNAGEMIQELILAKQTGTTLNDIFSKIYPYPVASRINQKAAFTQREGGLGEGFKKLIRWWWRF
ncbi:MAG: NAD(P)/FAD-dependent oxidoreductase [Saprospiraceae bacterium]